MTEQWIAQIEALGCAVQRDVPMRTLTSFKIGGPAKWVAYPENEAQVSKIVRLCCAAGIVPFVLGNGSNLLVSDDGYDGLVLSTARLDDCRVEGTKIHCGAGVRLTKVCMTACEQGLTGMEFAYGIPGSVGGAVFMNAGAYGGEMKDVLCSIRYITADGEETEIPATQAALGYRTSRFSADGSIITGAVFALKVGDPAQIRQQMNDIIGRRRSKQPLQYPSAGSTFKRPTGYYAGALIEQCGLKGAAVGGAQVSEMHAGFVINTGNATARDVLALIEYIQKTVKEQTGVSLEPEVRML